MRASSQRVGRRILDFVLKSYVELMRALTPAKDFAVGSTSGGLFKDGCISQQVIHPFETIADFHRLRGGITPEECTESNSDVFVCHGREYRTCFSQADLCPRNIILKPDGTPVIIDWEFSG